MMGEQPTGDTQKFADQKKSPGPFDLSGSTTPQLQEDVLCGVVASAASLLKQVEEV